jgi:15-cis-phytoene synthase
VTIEESYRFCEQVARSRAKNFYYSFVLLKRERRLAMCAVYAFMRYCDDLSDDVSIGNRREAIAGWRRDLSRALDGELPDDHAVWPAFVDTVRRFRIPHEYFFEMIEGVSSDLEPRRIESFDELYRYCYQVASVVGLTVIHIFGFEDPKALELAEECGIAFQLTNIIRDIEEDVGLGRVYMPAAELERFGVERFEYGPPFFEFMRFQTGRARQYYERSRPLIEMVSPESRSSLWALIEIYRSLLGKIEQSGHRVLDQRVRLSTFEKLAIAARAFTGFRVS